MLQIFDDGRFLDELGQTKSGERGSMNFKKSPNHRALMGRPLQCCCPFFPGPHLSTAGQKTERLSERERETPVMVYSSFDRFIMERLCQKVCWEVEQWANLSFLLSPVLGVTSTPALEEESHEFLDPDSL